MLQFCDDIMKEQLEMQPDCGITIKENPIIALKSIRVLVQMKILREAAVQGVCKTIIFCIDSFRGGGVSKKSTSW